MPDASPWTLRQRATKRSLDLVLAVPALILTAPLVLVATLAARIDTHQSGIFTQGRVGRGGRVFTVYKVRTMRSAGASTVTTSTDSRVTALGRLLRATKIDELPQLINVVRGDMSLVGPRPDVPGFADLLTGGQRVVLQIRPGITGPATLRYRHEERLLASVADPEAFNRDVVFPDKVQLNVAYVANYSLRADLAYLGRTLQQVLARDAQDQDDTESLINYTENT